MGRKAAFVAALLGLANLPAFAQSRFHGPVHSFTPRPVVSVRPMRTAPAASGIPTRVRPRTAAPATQFPAQSVGLNSAFFGGGFAGGTIQDLFGYPVPGLGFDYANYGALNGNLGVRALIDPVTQMQIALALKIRAATGGVSPVYFAPYGGTPIVMETPMVATQPEPQQPAPIVVVAPPPAQPAPAAQPAAEEQPLPDPGEFVLVQRDGRLLFAVAFTGEPGRVVYVTKEGLRRTIALAQLDIDATLRMNEERGTSIQLPAS